MNNPPATTDDQQAAAKRRTLRRTVLILAGVAVAIYVAFILSGVLGGGPAQ